ncbi:MAG: hypothetical protein R3C05_20580 [Pirellulaceae bacterium]
MNLCEPRVNMLIELSPSKSLKLRCGQRAYVRIDEEKVSMAQFLLRWAKTQLATIGVTGNWL